MGRQKTRTSPQAGRSLESSGTRKASVKAFPKASTNDDDVLLNMYADLKIEYDADRLAMALLILLLLCSGFAMFGCLSTADYVLANLVGMGFIIQAAFAMFLYVLPQFRDLCYAHAWVFTLVPPALVVFLWLTVDAAQLGPWSFQSFVDTCMDVYTRLATASATDMVINILVLTGLLGGFVGLVAYHNPWLLYQSTKKTSRAGRPPKTLNAHSAK